MKSAKMQTVHVSDLCDIPVYSRVISQMLVKKTTELFKSNKKYDVLPIQAGLVANKIYPITDFETVIGLRAAKIKEAPILIIKYDSMKELLADHVEKNFHPQVVDPLKMHVMVEYLVKNDKKMDVDTACKTLLLDRRPDLRNVAHLKIVDPARKVLLDMLDDISQRLHFVVTPTSYLRFISKIAPKEQRDAALELKAMTLPHMISDEKSVWPNNDMVEATLSAFHRIKKTKPVEQRILPIDAVDNLGRKEKNVSSTKKPDVKTIANASKYIADNPDMFYVPISGDHPDLLLNKKTGRVAIAKENGSTYTVTDDLGNSAYMLPNEVVQYLGIDVTNNLESLHIAKYPNIKKAASALAKIKDPDFRCVVISKSMLPRR